MRHFGTQILTDLSGHGFLPCVAHGTETQRICQEIGGERVRNSPQSNLSSGLSKEPLDVLPGCYYDGGMAKKHSTNLHFDSALFEWLKQEAERRHCSIGQVVRDLVVAEIERRSK